MGRVLAAVALAWIGAILAVGTAWLTGAWDKPDRHWIYGYQERYPLSGAPNKLVLCQGKTNNVAFANREDHDPFIGSVVIRTCRVVAGHLDENGHRVKP